MRDTMHVPMTKNERRLVLQIFETLVRGGDPKVLCRRRDALALWRKLRAIEKPKRGAK